MGDGGTRARGWLAPAACAAWLAAGTATAQDVGARDGARQGGAGQVDGGPGATSRLGAATGVELSWVRLAGAETCPGADVMRASVAGVLGQDPFGGAPYLRVEGVASRPEGGWAAVLFFRDADGGSLGSRDITSGAETCDSLAQAVVFAVALAIDPRVGLEADATTVRLADGDDGRGAAGASPGGTGGDGRGMGQREAGEGDDARAPGGAAEGGAPGAEGGAPGAEAGARAGGGDVALPGPSVVAGALVSAGTLPDSPGVGVALGVRGPVTLGWLSWGVGAFFFGPRENDDVGVSLAGAWAEVCVAGALADRVELRACPRFLGGGYVVYVRPGEIETSNPGAFSWLAAGVGLEGLVRIVGPLSVAVDVTPLVSLSRREFTAGGRDAPLFAEEPFALMAHLGLAWVF